MVSALCTARAALRARALTLQLCRSPATVTLQRGRATDAAATKETTVTEEAATTAVTAVLKGAEGATEGDAVDPVGNALAVRPRTAFELDVELIRALSLLAYR